jgi:tRNA pseudouridine13 synthase
MSDSTAARRLLPQEPPILTRHLPPVGGKIGPDCADFRVEELPAYLPSGAGEHRYVQVEKTGLSTPELVTVLSRAANLGERDIGYAGMKDKHAVTVQWLSLPRKCVPAEQWKLPNSVRVLAESYHTNKLRTGHLHGNRFNIRLVALEPDAATRLSPLLEVIKKGVLNAFGEQRFGHGGSNIDLALAWLSDPRSLRGKRARFLSKLYPSVLQSELFNRYLSARLKIGLDHLLLGEIVRLEGTGSNFVVEDFATEQIRYERREIHPQGPMFGPKMRPAAADALALEGSVLAELGLLPEALDALGSHAPGTRRDLKLTVSELTTELGYDALGAPQLRVTFSLPAGAYATQILRELCHTPWFAKARDNSPPSQDESISEGDSDASVE